MSDNTKPLPEARGYAPAIARLRAQALELEPELLRLMAEKRDAQRQNRLAEEINICRTAAGWLEDEEYDNKLAHPAHET